MIVKQVPNRHDGKSDFGELARYITEGIDSEEHAQAVRERHGFGPLTEYVARTQNRGRERQMRGGFNAPHSFCCYGGRAISQCRNAKPQC